MPSIVYIPTSGEYIVRVAVCLRNYIILGNKQGKSGKVRCRMKVLIEIEEEPCKNCKRSYMDEWEAKR